MANGEQILNNDTIVRISTVFTVFCAGIGLLISTVSKHLIIFLKEKNSANAATDKARADECEKRVEHQNEVLESLRKSLADLADIVEILNDSLETLRKEFSFARADLDKSRKESDVLRGELIVVKTLQLETLKNLQQETQLQIDRLVEAVSKMVEVSLSVPGAAKVISEIGKAAPEGSKPTF